MQRSTRSFVIGAATFAGILALSACSASTTESVDGPPPGKIDVKVKPYAGVPGKAVKSSVKADPALVAQLSTSLFGAVAAPGCPGYNGRHSNCWWGTNNAQTFTAANTLGAAGYTNAGYTLDHGCQDDVSGISPSPFTGNYFRAGAYSCGEGVEGYFSLSPPSVMSADTGQVQLFTDNPVGGTNSGSCNNTVYTSCTYNGDANGSSDHDVFYFTVNNYPVKVAITNNLPSADGDTLNLVAPPSVTGLISDPNGKSSNAESILPGETAYFGYYGAVVPSRNPIEGVSMTYGVPSASGDLAGSQFALNLMIDPSTGAYPTSGALNENQTTCTFLPGSTEQNATCTVGALQGAPGAVQTIPIDIHE